MNDTNNLFCFVWARRSTWRSIRVYYHGGAWVAEAIERDIRTNLDETTRKTTTNASPFQALEDLSNKLEWRERVQREQENPS